MPGGWQGGAVVIDAGRFIVNFRIFLVTTRGVMYRMQNCVVSNAAGGPAKIATETTGFSMKQYHRKIRAGIGVYNIGPVHGGVRSVRCAAVA